MTVDEPIQEDDVKELLQDVLLKENVQNAKIEFQRGSKVGDGFLGVNNAVTVTGDNKELKFFVKAAPKEETLREALISRSVFLTEINFYREVLPVFDGVLEKHDMGKLNLTGECYAINSDENKEMLIFDNLIEQGFRLFDKKQFLDENHVLLVLRSYAKFHGVSYVLKQESPTIFEYLSETIVNEGVELFKHFGFFDAVKSSVKIIREYNCGRIDDVALTKLDVFVDNACQFVEQCYNFECDQNIMIHGDCWVNNMLFKYEVSF